MAFSDIIGAAGVAMLLLAFALNLLGKLPAGGVLYSLMNTVGAGLSCYASVLIDYWPFVVLEGTWSLVAAVALVRALTRPRQG